MGRATSTAALSLALALLTQPASAEKKPAQPSLEEIAIMLSSADGNEVRSAIEAAAGLGSPDVIPMIGERVRAGLPADLLDAAIDSLMLLGDPAVTQVFVELSTHRRASVRLRAVQALASLKGKDAERVLNRALGDSDASVREAAAEGLGEIGAKGSVANLFRAFDRNVGQAARAVGRVASDSDAPRILGYLGHVPMTSLTPMFDALFARREISESVKLKIVVQLQELGTAEARGYLESLSKQLPPDATARVRRAVEDAIVRIAP